MSERIDLVVPMVFATDAKWKEKYAATCKRYGIPVNLDDERVRTWNLEKYFFRAIEKFMPWIDTIHLILDSETQIPDWLDASKVHIVYHKDIMPEELLPTFNSQAIEMWLHKIEGLAEKFIYANDDMIVVSPMEPTDFFVNGFPVIHCDEKYYDDLSGIFRTVCRETLELVAYDKGKYYGDGILLKDGHSYAPMLLSTLNACVEKYGNKMYKSCSPFREKKNYIQYLYTYYQWLNGIYVDGHHEHHYFSLGTNDDKIRKIIRSGNGGVCCFNDSGTGDWIEKGRVVREELDAILGETCKYEK